MSESGAEGAKGPLEKRVSNAVKHISCFAPVATNSRKLLTKNALNPKDSEIGVLARIPCVRSRGGEMQMWKSPLKDAYYGEFLSPEGEPR